MLVTHSDGDKCKSISFFKTFFKGCNHKYLKNIAHLEIIFLHFPDDKKFFLFKGVLQSSIWYNWEGYG